MRTHEDYVRKMAEHLVARQEQQVRSLLGQWVSECEPCVIQRVSTEPLLSADHLGTYTMRPRFHIVGLGYAGDPAGRVVVALDEAEPCR